MQLTTQVGRVYMAAIVLSLVLTVAGLFIWGSEESPWEAEVAPPAVSLIPLERVRDTYSAQANEVAAEIVEEVEAASAAVAEMTPAPTLVPPTPAPAPTEVPPVVAPEPAPVAPPPAPETPTYSPLSIPIPLTPEPPPPPPPPPGSLNYALADQLLLKINGTRGSAGLPLLSRHGSLMGAAEDYARFHFLNTDPFMLDHYLDGSPQDRAGRYGYGGGVAEVLVVGGLNADQLFQTWMNSPAHHDILMSGSYVNVGIACYQGPVQANGTTFEAALCVGDLGS